MMKTLFILSLLSIGLFARLNPFEPVNSQTEENPAPRTVTNLNSKDDGNRTVKVISDKKIEDKKEVKKIIKIEVPKEIKKAEPKKVETEKVEPKKVELIESKVAKEKPIDAIEVSAKEMNALSKENIKLEPISTSKNETTSKQNVKSASKTTSKHKIKLVKKSKIAKKTNLHKKRVLKTKKSTKKIAVQTPQTNSILSRRYNILPLLTIDVLDKSLTIATANNYKLIKYYEEQTENKFVFDFQAVLNVPTAKEEFDSQYYKSYTVGNHPEEGYFRVVIPVKDGLLNYKVIIKNNTGTIIHK